MNLGMSFRNSFGVLMMIAFFFAGCTTKQRQDRFEQGQGSDLLQIQDWDNKSFSLSTKDEIGKTSSSKANQLILSENQNKVRVYGLVAYETDAQLLKDVPFVGKPHTQYKIVYRLTDSFFESRDKYIVGERRKAQK